MAINDCGICDLVTNCGAQIMQADFPTVVTRLLCSISAQIEGQEVTPLFTTTLYSALTNSFAVALDDTNPKKSIIITNTTNQAVLVSYSGLVTQEYIPAGGSVSINYGEMGLYNSNKIYLAYASAPASGSVYISAKY